MRIVEKQYKKTKFSASDKLRIPGYILIFVGVLLGVFLVVADVFVPPVPVADGAQAVPGDSQLSILGVSGSARWIFVLGLIVFGWLIASAPTIQDWIDIKRKISS